MKRIVFLFGAGASYGAGSILPESPPLGFQLFRQLQKSYPGTWGRLPGTIRDELESDFERGMRLIYDQVGHAIPQLMRDMAVYFIQFRPVNRASLYCKLVDEIQRAKLVPDVLFSTLNYECVLEFAIAQTGIGLSYFDLGSDVALPVWKLHGSCNMFSEGVQAGQGVSYGTGVTWEGGIRALVSSDAVVQHCLVETGLAPVMSLYMEGKPLSVSPAAIKGLQEQWAGVVKAAEVVLCVGVRPLLADNHIWEPLRESTARLYFVGEQNAFNAWAAGRSGYSDFLAARFNEGFEQITNILTTYAN